MKLTIYLSAFIIFIMIACKQNCPDPILARVYEVVLDSSISSGYMFEHEPDIAHPDYSEIVVAKWTHGGPYVNHRYVVKFELNSIPTKARIDSAFITFSPADNLNSINVGGGQFNNYSNNAMFIEQIIDSWDETTVTWNNQPATTTTNQISVADLGTNNNGSGKISIKNFVTNWVATPSANNGLLMKLQDETTNTYRRVLFASNNHIDVFRRPVVKIYYTY